MKQFFYTTWYLKIIVSDFTLVILQLQDCKFLASPQCNLPPAMVTVKLTRDQNRLPRAHTFISCTPPRHIISLTTTHAHLMYLFCYFGTLTKLTKNIIVKSRFQCRLIMIRVYSIVRSLSNIPSTNLLVVFCAIRGKGSNNDGRLRLFLRRAAVDYRL